LLIKTALQAVFLVINEGKTRLMAKFYLIVAGISGFLAVALGAFGAHGLKAKLTPELMLVYQTGVQYQFYHTLAVLVLSVLIFQFPHAASFKWSAGLMCVGMVIFSGSLYILALSGVHWLGAITPIGGGCFLLGWGALIIGGYQHLGQKVAA